MAHRLTHAEQLTRSEHVAALATLRPVLDELIHRACRQQLAAVALMPRLSALRTPRAILSPRKPPLARRIRARRQRGVTRTLSQLPLQLLHPRLQLLDTQVHRQQNLDYSLTPRVINRLRLRALHTPRFDEAELCGACAVSVGGVKGMWRAHAALRLGFRLLEGWNPEEAKATCAEQGYGPGCSA